MFLETLFMERNVDFQIYLKQERENLQPMKVELKKRRTRST